MTPRIAAAIAVILTVAVSALPAYADDDNNVAKVPPVTTKIVWGEDVTWGHDKITRPLSRPAILPALYASYAALQAYDVYSTKAALARGAREANPLMQGVVKNSGAFVAVKVGAAAAGIVAAERLWKTNIQGRSRRPSYRSLLRCRSRSDETRSACVARGHPGS